jgi:hypothetical protein
MFTLWPPVRRENRDLQPPVRQALRGVALVVEMNLPWTLRSEDRLRAYALCERLAMDGGGVVYNPQEDRIVFPDLPDVAEVPVRQVTKPSLQPGRHLVIEWSLPSAGPSEGAEFLALLRSFWPGALPTRFGSGEPYNHRLGDPDGSEAFAALWDGGFNWDSKKPVSGGSVNAPHHRIPPGRRTFLVSVQADSLAIEKDAALCDRVVDLFVAVSTRLGALFGAAYVTRDILEARRGPAYLYREDHILEWAYGDYGVRWLGIPPMTTWLTWYGAPYRPLVASALGSVADEIEGGLLVRLGPAPMDKDAVRGLVPPLPPELLLTITPTMARFADRATSERAIERVDVAPAKVIPPFG